MGLTDYDRHLFGRTTQVSPLEAANIKISKLREALSYYRTADFLTTEQQKVAEEALR